MPQERQSDSSTSKGMPTAFSVIFLHFNSRKVMAKPSNFTLGKLSPALDGLTLLVEIEMQKAVEYFHGPRR